MMNTTTTAAVAKPVVAALVDTNRTYEQNVQLARKLHTDGWKVKSIAAMLHMPYVKTRWILKGLDGVKPRCASCGTMTTRVSAALGTVALCVACEDRLEERQHLN